MHDNIIEIKEADEINIQNLLFELLCVWEDN
jgi:hypothetical protein